MESPGAAAAGWLEAFDSGISAYLAGDFRAAQTHLARAQALNPDDMVPVALAQRCRRLALRNTGEWTGGWKLDEN